MEKIDPDLVDNPLIFPTDEYFLKEPSRSCLSPRPSPSYYERDFSERHRRLTQP